MSLIGISGSHGSGKSTLATKFTSKYITSVGFVPSNAGNIIKGLGFDPGADYDFSTRLTIQEAVLEGAIRQYDKFKVTGIADRTPLDFLTYLMTDITRVNVVGDDVERFIEFKKKCFNAVNKYFNVVIVLQPGINPVERENKGVFNKAYDEHYNNLLCGLVVSQELLIQHTLIPKRVIDLDQRVIAVEQSLNMAFNTFERTAIRKGATQLSGSIH